jgi:hypothetical protein
MVLLNHYKISIVKGIVSIDRNHIQEESGDRVSI